MYSPHKERYCYWNVTWLDIYLTILFLLSSCYLLLLSNQNQSTYLFLFDIPTKFMIDKEKTFLCEDLCEFYNVMPWNISFPGWRFPTFYGLQQKKISCCQLCWQLLVNASLISQFQENVISFNFLANTLKILLQYSLEWKYCWFQKMEHFLVKWQEKIQI